MAIDNAVVVKTRQYNLYTKSAAAQFRMSKMRDIIKRDPVVAEEGWHLFVEAAKATGVEAKPYDWANKIVLHLSPADLGTFLWGFKTNFTHTDHRGKPTKFEIYHDPGKGGATEGQRVKSMGFEKGKEYGYMLNFRGTTKVDNAPVTQSFTVPVKEDQLCVLRILFEEAVKLVTGFHEDGSEAQSRKENG